MSKELNENTGFEFVDNVEIKVHKNNMLSELVKMTLAVEKASPEEIAACLLHEKSEKEGLDRPTEEDIRAFAAEIVNGNFDRLGLC